MQHTFPTRSDSALPSSRLGRALGTLLLVFGLAACAGEFDTVGEALRLLQPNLPGAVLGEPYEAAIHATGGLRPYTFQLDSGALPAGITLQNGALRGSPTVLGEYEFSIAVSDGNLNKTVQEYRLAVTEVPPPTFTLLPPETEVRAPVTLRARVGGARDLAAVRFLVTWDAASFRLRPGSVSAAGRDVALLSSESEGQLQVDVAALGRTLTGEHTLFSFVLEPLVEPATLWLDQRVEFLSLGADPGKQHHFLRQTEGRRSSLAGGSQTRQEDGTSSEEQDGLPPEDDEFGLPDDPSGSSGGLP